MNLNETHGSPMGDLDQTYPTPNGLPIGFDKRFTLTNERTNELTNDYQDQGSNSQVPNAPRGVDKRFSVDQRIIFTRAQWGMPDRKGRVSSLWSWPVVSVQLWSCQLGRYVYGNTAIHERFLLPDLEAGVS